MGVVPPFDSDPAVERWGTNAMMFRRYGGEFDAWTRWFDLHQPDQIQARRPEAWQWYTQQDARRPIYSWAVQPEIPASTAYPLDRFKAAFDEPGREERDCWGSLSWMLALAILDGFTDVDLFWFVNDTHQHGSQIPSVRYWIGQCRGRGMRVTIHGDSELKPHGRLYGLET